MASLVDIKLSPNKNGDREDSDWNGVQGPSLGLHSPKDHPRTGGGGGGGATGGGDNLGCLATQAPAAGSLFFSLKPPPSPPPPPAISQSGWLWPRPSLAPRPTQARRRPELARVWEAVWAPTPSPSLSETL